MASTRYPLPCPVRFANRRATPATTTASIHRASRACGDDADDRGRFPAAVAGVLPVAISGGVGGGRGGGFAGAGLWAVIRRGGPNSAQAVGGWLQGAQGAESRTLTSCTRCSHSSSDSGTTPLLSSRSRVQCSARCFSSTARLFSLRNESLLREDDFRAIPPTNHSVVCRITKLSVSSTR